MGDLHDPHYDLIQVSSHIFDVSNQQIQLQKETMVNYGTIPFTTNGCATYTLSFYASQEMDDQYQTYWPTIVTICAALALIMMIIAFIGYDRWMEQREQAISRQAMQSSAIVSSLFPKVVRDRLLNPTGKPEDAPLVVDTSLHGSNMNQIQPPASTKLRLKSFLNSGDNVVDDVGDLMNDQTNKRGSTMYGGLSAAQASQPIADLFLETTVMFADIAGFTAWCSVREPPQVFILLESVYGEFDSLAKRRKVFKVETIGDSYVAVTGLPEPLADHGAFNFVFFASPIL